MTDASVRPAYAARNPPARSVVRLKPANGHSPATPARMTTHQTATASVGRLVSPNVPPSYASRNVTTATAAVTASGAIGAAERPCAGTASGAPIGPARVAATAKTAPEEGVLMETVPHMRKLVLAGGIAVLATLGTGTAYAGGCNQSSSSAVQQYVEQVPGACGSNAANASTKTRKVPAALQNKIDSHGGKD